MNVNFHDMTTEEKLRTMELLWDDLCRSIPQMPSPAWHEQILQERERNLQAGKERVLDWEHAKKEIWNAVL